jgi:hypothetical protein
MKPVTMTGGYDGQPLVQPRQCYRTSSCHAVNDGTRRTVRGRSTGTLTCLTGLGGAMLARGGIGNFASCTRRLASSASSPRQPSLSRNPLTRRGPMLMSTKPRELDLLDAVSGRSPAHAPLHEATEADRDTVAPDLLPDHVKDPLAADRQRRIGCRLLHLRATRHRCIPNRLTQSGVAHGTPLAVNR